MTANKLPDSAVELIGSIEDKIYAVRGKKVMLDSDLAGIYGVETRILKQAVRRNRNRFPEDFMLELSIEETRQVDSLRSQIVILKNKGSQRGRHSKYGTFAFTEHGAVMLASILNSPSAIEASIVVVRAFVKMRSILALHKDLAKRIERLAKVAVKHENDFDVVFHLLGEIMGDSKYLKRKIGFIEPKKRKGK